MRIRSILTVLLLIIASTPYIRTTLAQDEIVLSAFATATPTIDGDLSSFPGEWTDTIAQPFELTWQEKDHNATLYVKNDLATMYITVVIELENYSDLDALLISFDLDNDGQTWREGDDTDALLATPGGLAMDGYFDPAKEFPARDDLDSGTNDIEAAVGHTNPAGVGNYTFEFSHPLCSGDTGTCRKP